MVYCQLICEEQTIQVTEYSLGEDQKLLNTVGKQPGTPNMLFVNCASRANKKLTQSQCTLGTTIVVGGADLDTMVL